MGFFNPVFENWPRAGLERGVGEGFGGGEREKAWGGLGEGLAFFAQKPRLKDPVKTP